MHLPIQGRINCDLSYGCGDIRASGLDVLQWPSQGCMCCACCLVRVHGAAAMWSINDSLRDSSTQKRCVLGTLLAAGSRAAPQQPRQYRRLHRARPARASMTGSRLRTTALVNLAMVVEQANEQVLPAVYLFVGRSLNATPVQLGTLTLCRAMVQTLASPLSGILGDRFDRVLVLSSGAFIWGIMTSAMALTVTLHQVRSSEMGHRAL